MARAFVGAVECQVTVDRDLGDSWAVAVLPPGKAPLIVKLQGNDKAAVTAGALKILKDRGLIDDFKD